MQTSTSIENEIESLKKDMSVRLTRLNDRLKAAHFQADQDSILADIEKISNVYNTTLLNKRKELDEARQVEENQLKKIKSGRAAREAEMKSNALSVWMMEGGDKAKFEQAWPAIRETILNERVISAFQKSNGSSSNGTGRVSL